jgi:hypothetical protein
MDYNTALKKWQNAFKAAHPSLIREPESELIKVDEVKLKSIVEVVEILAPLVDPANRITLIQWACDNVNEFQHIISATLDLDYDILEQYELEKAESGATDDPGVEGEEPKPPSPNGRSDSVNRVVQLIQSRRNDRLSENLNRGLQNHTQRLGDLDRRVDAILRSVASARR